MEAFQLPTLAEPETIVWYGQGVGSLGPFPMHPKGIWLNRIN